MYKSLLMAAAAVAVFTTFAPSSALAMGNACASSWAEYQASAPPKAFALSANGNSCGHWVNRGQAGVTLEDVTARAMSNCIYNKGTGCRITASQDVPRGMTPAQALMHRSRGN